MPDSEQRSVFAAVVATIAGFHMLAVTLAAIPTNSVSDAVGSQLTYLSPFFAQNWRLFAPNPIDKDKSLLVQAAYVDREGNLHTTPWVDWTTVELGVIKHRLVGGRAGYVTTKFFDPLNDKFRHMTRAQRTLSERSSPLAPPSWSELRGFLARVGPTPDLDDYLRFDRAAARLATDVVDERWPDRDVTAVRYALREQGVVPFDARHGNSAEREAARPAPTLRVSGWRAPTYGSAAEGRGVGEFDRRHG